MFYSTYDLQIGDVVKCMRCRKEFKLTYEPDKCCRSEQDAVYNLCGCRGAPEPIFCEECWKELTNE